MRVEPLNGRADYYFSKYAKTGKITTIDERVNRINKITTTEIQDMAREIFKGDEVKIGSVGILNLKTPP